MTSGEQGIANPIPTGLLKIFLDSRLGPGVRCFTMAAIGTKRGSKTKYKSIYGLGLIVLDAK